MMLPGVLTIGFPLVIAFLPMLFGMEHKAIAEMLGGYMAGVTVSGVLWAIFQNNAGGAWDNAKKSFEAGVEINGEMTYKGSDAHKAAVTGDTVGDPFKDTSGPSMNILIKLTCLIGLVIAPILGGHSEDGLAITTQDGAVVEITQDGRIEESREVQKEVRFSMAEQNGQFVGTVTTITDDNGDVTTEVKEFTGTEAQVKQQMDDYEKEIRN